MEDLEKEVMMHAFMSSDITSIVKLVAVMTYQI